MKEYDYISGRISKERGTEDLLRTAVAMVMGLVKGEAYPLVEKIAEAKGLIARTELGPSTEIIISAAKQRIAVIYLLDAAVELGIIGYGLAADKRAVRD